MPPPTPPPPPPFSAILSYLTKTDIEYSSRIHRLSLGWFDYLLAVPGVMCSSACVPGIIALSYLSTSLPLGVFTTISSVSTVLLTEACKKGTHRERPLHGTIHLRRFNLRSLLTNFSFPSGDSAQAGVLGLAFFLYASAQQHALAPLWLTLIPAVMFSRVYFGCHWIGDVLVGAGIGVGVTGALWLLWCRALGLPMPHAAATTVIKEMIS